MLKLEIPNNIFDDMLEQARAEAPIEACGILAGGNGRVEKLYKMTNVEKRRDHFMMAPAEQFAAVKDIRSASLDMLAVYHSHPETPARPSAEDIRLALTPGMIHVIVSLQGVNGPVVKGFQIEDGSINEVPVKIVEEKK
ncbi:MAG: M67 family metallopeptidase [Planctomycetota bacterium]|jgi:proteasome lid subunit RPN8/RPN11